MTSGSISRSLRCKTNAARVARPLFLCEAHEPLQRGGAQSGGRARNGCDEGRLCAGLAHAYHHLNFAWNGRKKTMAEADAQFSLNENFPRPSESGFCFNRYWSKRCLKCLVGGKNHRP